MLVHPGGVGRDSANWTPMQCGVRGTSGVIHLPWQSHSGRQTREALSSALQDEYPCGTRNREQLAGTPSFVFQDFFFYIGLTWQFFPWFLKSSTYSALCTSFGKCGPKSLSSSQGRWERDWKPELYHFLKKNQTLCFMFTWDFLKKFWPHRKA